MRILFISAFYPPNVVGGWEQLVEDIDTRLRQRGHQTLVLTSASPSGSPSQENGHVSRVLTLESDLLHYQPAHFFWGRDQRHGENLRRLDDAIAQFTPDVIFVHVMWNLWKGIPWHAERRLPGKVVYYVADDWPYAPDLHRGYWQQEAERAWMRPLKRVIGARALKRLDREDREHGLSFEHVICVSEMVRMKLGEHLDLDPEKMRVVRNGVEIDHFQPPPPQARKKAGKGLALLYAGSIIPTKGVHTAIEALVLLVQCEQLGDTSLTIVGSGHPDYEARLRAMVEEHHLGGRVSFQGRISRQDMPALMQRFDAFVFPSTGEALPRVVEEAMACGLPVIGTAVGGTGEILIEEETGLTFLPGDAAGLANQICRLLESPEMYARLADRGRGLIMQQYDIEKTVDQIEDYLQGLMRAWS